MRFRLKALGLHLLASAVVLTLILGSLYWGWYHWPGWYLADVTQVVLVMMGVDVVVGPLLTFVIANKNKPRRELTRDIGMIVAVQLVALIYGSTSLWNGRPLYYAFSVNVLSVVQAYDISDEQAKAGRAQNAALAPHWYSLPRWIWAPLPESPQESDKIVRSAISGGDDVISMPTYFKPWDQGLPSLRGQLTKLDDSKFFSKPDKMKLKERMAAAGLKSDQADTMAFTGRSKPLLAVFDRESLKIIGIFKST
jgi:hypothetical protein